MFFAFFGLQINPADLPGVAAVAAGLAVFTAATKIATGWWSAARAGIGRAGRLRAGTVLTVRGEFSIVIAGIAVAEGVNAEIGPLAAAYVLLLAVGGPLLARAADPISRRRARLDRGSERQRSHQLRDGSPKPHNVVNAAMRGRRRRSATMAATPTFRHHGDLRFDHRRSLDQPAKGGTIAIGRVEYRAT